MGSACTQCFWGLRLFDNILWIPFHTSKYAFATKLFIWDLFKNHLGYIESSSNINGYGSRWTPVSERRIMKHLICAICLCIFLNIILPTTVWSNIIPILQLRKLRSRGVIGFVQGIPAGLWKSSDTNPCYFVSQAFAAIFHYLKSPHTHLVWMKMALG